MHRSVDIERAARGVVAPTLMHVQRDDEVFPREGQLALFDVLGAAAKRLLTCPGPHSCVPQTAEQLWVDFVVSHT